VLDGAKCGDTLLLAAGASFPINNSKEKLRDRHYITGEPTRPIPNCRPRVRGFPRWGGVGQLPAGLLCATAGGAAS